jgi:hypothetical protein
VDIRQTRLLVRSGRGHQPDPRLAGQPRHDRTRKLLGFGFFLHRPQVSQRGLIGGERLDGWTCLGRRLRYVLEGYIEISSEISSEISYEISISSEISSEIWYEIWYEISYEIWYEISYEISCEISSEISSEIDHGRIRDVTGSPSCGTKVQGSGDDGNDGGHALTTGSILVCESSGAAMGQGEDSSRPTRQSEHESAAQFLGITTRGKGGQGADDEHLAGTCGGPSRRSGHGQDLHGPPTDLAFGPEVEQVDRGLLGVRPLAKNLE